MKLWKENKISQQWEMDNKEIAKRWVDYEKERLAKLCPLDLKYLLTGRNLVFFISSKEGLNSTWEWDLKKGSVEGSEDMLEILDIVDEMLKGDKK